MRPVWTVVVAVEESQANPFLKVFKSKKLAEPESWEENFGANLSDPGKISNTDSKVGELTEARQRNETLHYYVNRAREGASLPQCLAFGRHAVMFVGWTCLI